jgi:hypothetical protein
MPLSPRTRWVECEETLGLGGGTGALGSLSTPLSARVWFSKQAASKRCEVHVAVLLLSVACERALPDRPTDHTSAPGYGAVFARIITIIPSSRNYSYPSS